MMKATVPVTNPIQLLEWVGKNGWMAEFNAGGFKGWWRYHKGQYDFKSAQQLYELYYDEHYPKIFQKKKNAK